MEKLDQYIHLLFYVVISALGYMGMRTLDDLTASVKDLNQNVAVVIERTNWQGRELDKHDKRLERLETTSRRPLQSSN